MERTFVRGPLYDRMKREFAPSEEYFDEFMGMFLESLQSASAFASTTSGGRILITPELTKYFGLDEDRIREIAYAMRDFYWERGMANTVFLGVVPPIRSKRGRKPEKPRARHNTELFGVNYGAHASFSGWLMNHADEKYRQYFSALLDDFSNARDQRKPK